MNTAFALSDDKRILLESGTNEVEILLFQVGELSLGVNVAKVREVLPAQHPTRLPNLGESLDGCFRLRDTVVPCVSLHRFLGEPASRSPDDSVVILTEFNQSQLAFSVDVVERIHRISWNQVFSVPSLIVDSQAPITAITRIGERLILMLDFEMIAERVSGTPVQAPQFTDLHAVDRATRHVVVVDDSITARTALTTTLEENGYTSLHVFENGALAWSWLEGRLQTDTADNIDLVISDVEMPQMDGLHLTKRIKDHPRGAGIPVLLYSSILSPDNLKKGRAVGADAQITKPELHRIVETADRLIHESRGLAASAARYAPLPLTGLAATPLEVPCPAN